MQEITLADGAELAVAEEACQAHRAEALLDQFSVMIGLPKKAPAATIATAETSTVEWRLLETLTRSLEQYQQKMREAQERQRRPPEEPGIGPGETRIC